MSDVHLASVLRLKATHVRDLTVPIWLYGSHLHLCNVIKQQVPMLQSLTIDYEKDRLSFNQAMEIKSVFGHLPRLVINRWEEYARRSRSESKTVVLDVSN